MRHKDLGELEGPILIFGGAYSNLQATRALIEAAYRHDIPAHRCIFTGDSIACCANPVETLNLLREFGCPMIRGNCEIELARGSDTCGCGFAADSTCDLLSRGWYAYANQCVSLDQRHFMGSLPDQLLFHHHGKRYVVLHGGYHTVAKFLFPTTLDREFINVTNEIRNDVGVVDSIIAGHSGIAFQKSIDGVMWLNSGAIGMPAHNGLVTTSYAILEAGSFTVHELPYDHVTAKNAMIAAGLNQGYHATLSTGYWPSEEVLPMDLRRVVDSG